MSLRNNVKSDTDLAGTDWVEMGRDEMRWVEILSPNGNWAMLITGKPEVE